MMFHPVYKCYYFEIKIQLMHKKKSQSRLSLAFLSLLTFSTLRFVISY